MLRLLKGDQAVFVNSTKVIVAEPTPVKTVWTAMVFDKQPDGSLVPCSPETHSVESVMEFVDYYKALAVPQRLVLA